MTEWKEIELGEIAQLQKKSWKVGDKDLPYIALEHIVEGALRLQGLGNSKTVVSNKYYFDSHCFLFGKLRPYFRKLYRPNFEGICSTDIWVVKPKEDNDRDFLFYFFANQEFVDFTYSGSSGTRMPRADWNFVSKSIWKLPEPVEQRAIASVLSSLDDKIDLLHRQNKTLEEMAETLFRQWFVPAEASAQAGVEEASEEWKVGKLADEFDFTMGASPPGKSYNETGIGIPMYQGNADFGFRFPKNRVYTTEPKRFAEKNDTLISVRAPVGEQNMANERCCIGRGVSAFRYKHDNSFYTYTYYKMKSLMDDIKQFNETGTVFGSISKSDFENIEISIPDKQTVGRFQNEAKPIDDKIILNTKQIHTLENLRDNLLPKLMNGEIII